MKRILYAATILLSTTITEAQTGRVGIGESNPGSKGAIKGNLSVGSGYSQTAAPTDGAIIEGRVGIGTNSPNSGAALDIQSTNKGILIPRVNGTGAVSAPVNGMLVYNTQDNKFYYYDGSQWKEIGAGGGGGVTGATGPTGAKGDTGEKGETGSQGLQGNQGPQGAQGITGVTGGQGPQGIQGPQGNQGAQGPAGPQGAQGITGVTGGQGPQGIQGPQGNQGVQGPAGPQGAQGITGVTGGQGPQGIQGPQGNQGAQGPAGPQGAQGITGVTGGQGPQGIQGPQGPAGPQGATGLLSAGVTGSTPYYNGSSWVVNSTNIYNLGANVGIGTTSPSSKLTVIGSIHLGTTGDDLSTPSYAIKAISGSSVINGGNGRELFLEAGVSDNSSGKRGGHLYLRPGQPTAPATLYGSVIIADQGGYAGLGTGAPLSKLHIAGNGGVDEYIRLENIAAGRNSRIGHDANGMFFRVSNNGDTYRWTNTAGDVLMSMNPTTQVLSVTNLVSGGNGAIVRSNASGNLSITNFSGSGTDVLTGAGTFTGITSLVSDDWTASGSYLYQNNLGLNVGIGNNAPQFKLQVGTDANRSFNVASNGYTYVRFDDNNVVPVFNVENRGMTATGHGVIQSFNLATGGGAGIASGQIRVSSEDTYAAAASRDAQMSFATISNGSLGERVWIKSNGNVGINTSSVAERLVVNGNIMYNSIRSVETVQTAYTNVTSKRYHVSTKYQGGSRSSIALDMTIMEELCADEDGCRIKFVMKRWDSDVHGNAAASREANFFYDASTGRSRLDFPTGDGSTSIDGDGGETHIYKYWSCYFSDYAHIANTAQNDGSRSLHLLAWNDDGHTNLNKTCEMIVED